MQQTYDLWHAGHRMKAELSKIETVPSVAEPEKRHEDGRALSRGLDEIWPTPAAVLFTRMVHLPARHLYPALPITLYSPNFFIVPL